MTATAQERGQRWIPEVDGGTDFVNPERDRIAKIPDGQPLPKKRPEELVALMSKEVPAVATILALVVLSKMTRNDTSSLVPKLEETIAGLCYPYHVSSLFERNYRILPPPATSEKTIIPYLVGLNDKGEQAESTNHFAARITADKIRDLWRPNQPPSGKEEHIIKFLMQLRQKGIKLKRIIREVCKYFDVDPKNLPKIKSVEPDWTILNPPQEKLATDDGVFERLEDLDHYFNRVEASMERRAPTRRAPTRRAPTPISHPIETKRKPFEEEKTFEDFVSSIPFPSDEAERKKEPWVRIQKVINLVMNLNLDKAHLHPALDQECRIALLVYYVFVNVKIPNAERTDTTITSKKEIAELLGFIRYDATEAQAKSGVKKMQGYLDLIDNNPALDPYFDKIKERLSSASVKPKSASPTA